MLNFKGASELLPTAKPPINLLYIYILKLNLYMFFVFVKYFFYNLLAPLQKKKQQQQHTTKQNKS